MNKLIITIAQLNFTVGDLEGNKKKILDAYTDAQDQKSDLLVFSEMCVTGYPAEDLVLLPRFQEESSKMVEELAQATRGSKTAMLVGSLGAGEKRPRNSVFLLADGEVVHQQDKFDLPNYGVFDEQRVFEAGDMPSLVEYRGVKFGIMICEDMWNMKVAGAFVEADIMLSINGSPFEVGKHAQRVDRVTATVAHLNKPLIYVNQICGQDDLVFDGDSFVVSAAGEKMLRLPRFAEKIQPTFWQQGEHGWQCDAGSLQSYSSEEEMIYLAMMLGLRDYVNKNNFPGVVIGMSGGVDSALSAAVAVDALGAQRVRLVMMPSRYTSKESIDDATQCAKNLGVELENIDIEPMVAAYTESLSGVMPARVESQNDRFEVKDHDGITEQNLQSRIRGMLLMAISNKFGHMVLSTGNKSEVSVGYSTLYGDMCGGYNVLKDIYKMQVFAVSRWRNSYLPDGCFGSSGLVIPDNIITKPPTAELCDNQKDSDSLPEYDVLDPILIELIEEGRSVDEVIALGRDAELVERISKLLYFAEYKRRQSAPGVKISRKPFSRDRRYPITNKFGG